MHCNAFVQRKLHCSVASTYKYVCREKRLVAPQNIFRRRDNMQISLGTKGRAHLIALLILAPNDISMKAVFFSYKVSCIRNNSLLSSPFAGSREFIYRPRNSMGCSGTAHKYTFIDCLCIWLSVHFSLTPNRSLSVPLLTAMVRVCSYIQKHIKLT